MLTHRSALALVLALAACGPAPTAEVELPVQLPLSDLPPASLERLRIEATIPGVLASGSLRLDSERGIATGEFTVGDTDVDETAMTVRFFSALTETSPEVLIGQADGVVAINKGKRNRATVSTPVTDGSVLLDLNRNGRSNLDDLIAGFDPMPGEPPIDVSPGTVSFASGIDVGGFTRAFFVVENTSEETVRLELQVRLAPGVTVMPLNTLFEVGGSSASTTQTLELAGRSEEVFAVTFAPANPLFMLGSVSLTTTKLASGVQHSRMMRLLGNPEGSVPQPPQDYAIPLPGDGVSIGGYTGDVTAYPASSLFSRAPNITSVVEQDSGSIGAIDVDSALMVLVPGRFRFAVTLDGLTDDVDVHLFELDDAFQPIGLPADSSMNAGTSAESVEFDATTKDADTLVLLAFDGVGVDDDAPLAGAMEGEEGSATAQAALFSVPEFLLPCLRDGAGDLVDSACVDPITSAVTCAGTYAGALACGPAVSTTRFSVRGKNLKEGAQVRVGDSFAVCTDIESNDTYDELHCLAPPAVHDASETPHVAVVISNPDGQAATLADGFTYLPPPPVVFSIVPGSGPTTGGRTVTMQGTGFFAREGILPEVTFGGVPATQVELLTANQLRVVTPACTACADGERVDVEVNNPDGQAGKLFAAFAYTTPADPAPEIVSLDPAIGPRRGGTTVTLTGSNFSEGMLIRLGGATCPGVSVVDATTATFITPPGAPGIATLEVSNRDGQTARALGAYEFLVPDPVVATLSPASGPEAGGNSVLISGSDFQSGAVVAFGANPSPNALVLSSSLISAVAPVGTGVVDLTVTNLDGRSDVAEGVYTYNAPDGPPPQIAAVAPGRGSTAGGDVVLVTGSDFVNGAVVFFGGASAVSVTFVSDTELRAFTPAFAEGAVDVSVRNPDGQLAVSGLAFTYEVPPPVATSVFPPSGPVDGGTLIQVSGTAFSTGALVQLGGRACLNVEVLSSNLLRCLTPAGAGSVAITVSNPDGQQSALPDGFTYAEVVDPPPLLTSLFPNHGSADGGVRVLLRGQGFHPEGCSVTFGGVAAAVEREASSATELSVLTPAGVAGERVDVVVQNPDGQGTTGSYLYEAAEPEAQLTTVVPPEVDAYEESTVVLFGQGFAEGAVVNFEQFAPDGTLLWRGEASDVAVLTPQMVTVTTPLFAGNLEGAVLDDGSYRVSTDVVVQMQDLELRTSGRFWFVDVTECLPDNAGDCGGTDSCQCDDQGCACVDQCQDNPGGDCGCGGTCIEGRCSGESCAAGQECQGSVCVDLCDPGCVSGEACVLGENGWGCQVAGCDPTCPAGSTCVEERGVWSCETDTCVGSGCCVPECTNGDVCTDVEGSWMCVPQSGGSCGDGTRTYPEACDGDDLGGLTCVDLGFGRGTLACTTECALDTVGCLPTPNCRALATDDPALHCTPGEAVGASCSVLENTTFVHGELACSNSCVFESTSCEDATGGSPGCGNGALDPVAGYFVRLEGCDSALAVAACSTLDLGGGTPSCDDDCNLDTSACEIDPCGNNRIDHVQAQTMGVMEECDSGIVPLDCSYFGYGGGSLGCSDCRYDFSQCLTPAPHCENRVFDASTSETDIDCGGDCAPCGSGANCAEDEDCRSGKCDASGKFCVAATCADAIKNGTESGVDCGGHECSRCVEGGACYRDADCAIDQLCAGGVCSVIECTTEPDPACPPGTTCQGNQCVQPEDPDAGQCVSDAGCEPGHICDDLTSQCEPGTRCAGDEECSQDEVCDQELNKCVAP